MILKKSFLIVVSLFLLAAFDEPCTKRIVKKEGSYIELYFPSCKDSSTYLARVYEHTILVRETWTQNNKPTGIEITYSADRSNLVSGISYWENLAIPVHISYFNETKQPQKRVQKINDSAFYNIEYYFNGNIKTYGLVTKQGCRYGTWVEHDSLGITKWKGKYKEVAKEEKISYERGTIRSSWCFEKDSIWIKTDLENKILEQKIYRDGKVMNNR